MDVTTHIDLTLPIWSLAGVVGLGVFHIVRMHFKLEKMEQQNVDLKNELNDVRSDIADLKKYIIKNFTTNV